MILVTVGAQMPFDRMIEAVDAWAGRNPSQEVIAQIGPNGWKPQHMRFVEFFDPLEFRRLVQQAQLVVTHAGMGTILTALEMGKPLILMPRRGDLGETRNDHQVATARQLASLGRAAMAFDRNQLKDELDHLSQLKAPQQISASASPQLLDALRSFVLHPPGDGLTPSSAADSPGSQRAAMDSEAAAHNVGSNGGGSNGGSNGGPSGGTNGDHASARGDLHGQREAPSPTAASSLIRQRSGVSAASGIAAVVLLAGGTGLNELAKATERSVLQLPITADQTLLSLWRSELEVALASRTDAPIEVRIVGGALIRYEQRNPNRCFTIEHDHDPHELRGTGGILHDIAQDYADAAHLLVASASTLLLEPLDALVAELARQQADVAFFVHEDESAPNLMLIRCGCLRSISRVGYVDWKEQALPHIASVSSVSMIRRRKPVAATIRTSSDYLRTLRHYHGRKAGPPGSGIRRMDDPPFVEDWKPAFGIREVGATVEEGACLHDSVVLGGAQVGANAVLVRCVVCPGAVVPAQALISDEVVWAQSRRHVALAIGATR